MPTIQIEVKPTPLIAWQNYEYKSIPICLFLLCLCAIFVETILYFTSDENNGLIVLGFNDTSTLVGHFCRLLEKGRKEIEEIAVEIKERDW